MESCMGVEPDLDKALTKFRELGEHSDQVLSETIANIENLKQEISEIPPEETLSYGQTSVVKEAVQKCKEAMQKLVQDHRELHASVSRVGKCIDRQFVADFGAVAPRAESFCTETNRALMEEAIAHHLYREGLDDVGDAFLDESGLTSVERSQPFAELQRTANALEAGDTGPALKWLEAHEDQLEDTPLPFMLHRMHFLKLGRECGPGAAVAYAREHLSRFAGRYSRELAAAVCALAWLVPRVPPPPEYLQLLDPVALGGYTRGLYLREACSVLRVSPTSAVWSATVAGTRVLPALHDIRSKMSHPHVAAWADELPLGVDLGDATAAYHSVFACPILRQQASDQNPPMRLLCGHVISRDALTKLAQGPKLKCPYCPMEQSPSEARQIYFS